MPEAGGEVGNRHVAKAACGLGGKEQASAGSGDPCRDCSSEAFLLLTN